MAKIVYGFWDGTVYDNRDRNLFEIDEIPEMNVFQEFNQGNLIKAFFGDRGFFVFSRDTDLLDALHQYMVKAAQESCGKCTPCRMGTSLIRDRLEALRLGRARADLLDEVEQLAAQVHETSLCGLGKTCTAPLLGAIGYFRDEIEREIAGANPRQHGLTYVTAPCIEACPAKINVPRYIDYIRDGKPAHSLGVILQKYPMAATCGRVCVRFCEMACQRKMVDEAVGIKLLKRYVADYEQDCKPGLFSRDLITTPQPDNLKVAVIGAGPAGICCAYHLLLKGYPVDVFEAKNEAGGMASTGIPSYRLPKDVLKVETDIIEQLGGRIFYNQQLGRDFRVDDLFQRGYKAIFLAVGCAEGRLLGVQGEDISLGGYESGIDFLLAVHDHVEGSKTMTVYGDVVVVGGGNVAMDCARSALRMGADTVHLVYRRTRGAMPADHEEIEAAEKEGIVFHVLTNPTGIISENGAVMGLEVTRTREKESGSDGRRDVEAVPGSEYVMKCNMVVAAIGQQVAANVISPEDGIMFDKWGCVAGDRTSLATDRKGVFVGGDCFFGPSTLIHAMANGLKGARSISDYLQFGRTRFFPRSRMRQIISGYKVMSNQWLATPVEHKYRVGIKEMDPDIRKGIFDEVEKTITPEEAYHEAGRCLRCYRIYSVITEYAIPEGCA